MSSTNLLKEHVSYSEVRVWKECSWRHKLLYLDKIETFEESPHLYYGSIVHDAVEHFLKTKELKLQEMEESLRKEWERVGFDGVWREEQEKKNKDYKHIPFEKWLLWAQNSVNALPQWMDENFPQWETVSAEEMLYEEMQDLPLKFKGYIDCIINNKSSILNCCKEMCPSKDVDCEKNCKYLETFYLNPPPSLIESKNDDNYWNNTRIIIVLILSFILIFLFILL